MPSKYVPTGRPAGRPKGHKLSAESRAAISAGQKRAWALRRAELDRAGRVSK